MCSKSESCMGLALQTCTCKAQYWTWSIIRNYLQVKFRPAPTHWLWPDLWFNTQTQSLTSVLGKLSVNWCSTFAPAAFDMFSDDAPNWWQSKANGFLVFFYEQQTHWQCCSHSHWSLQISPKPPTCFQWHTVHNLIFSTGCVCLYVIHSDVGVSSQPTLKLDQWHPIICPDLAHFVPVQLLFYNYYNYY